jgi:hypothetical protein
LDYGDKEAECGYTELVYSQFNRPELFVQFVELQHDDPAPKPLTIKQRLAMFLKLKN